MKDETPIEEGVLNLRLSDIRTWQQCPRRFYFEVLQKLYPQPSTPAYEATADIIDVEYEIDEDHVVKEREAKRRDEGTLVHAVAEAYYKGKFDDLADDPFSRQDKVDQTVDDKARTLTTDILTESWYNARRYAKVSARGFIPWLEREGHDVETRVLACEQRLTTRIPFPKAGTRFHEIQVTGQPDVVQRDLFTEGVQVGDTKHVQTLTKGKPRDCDLQLVGYAWLWERNTDDRVEFAYQNRMARSLQTARAKGPFYERVPVAITEAKLREFEQNLRSELVDIARWIKMLEKGRRPEHLTLSQTQLCDWMCRSQLLCDSMSAGRGWRATANEFYGGTYEQEFDDA